MRHIYIFTEDYADMLTQRLPNAVPYLFSNLQGLAVRDSDDAVRSLADIAAQVMNNNDLLDIDAKIRDFLMENEYIHLDAFIRICLEDIDA